MVHKTGGVEGSRAQQCRDVWLPTLENLKNLQYCLPEAVRPPDGYEEEEKEEKEEEGLEGSSGCFLL